MKTMLISILLTFTFAFTSYASDAPTAQEMNSLRFNVGQGEYIGQITRVIGTDRAEVVFDNPKNHKIATFATKNLEGTLVVGDKVAVWLTIWHEDIPKVAGTNPGKPITRFFDMGPTGSCFHILRKAEAFRALDIIPHVENTKVFDPPYKFKPRRHQDGDRLILFKKQ